MDVPHWQTAEGRTPVINDEEHNGKEANDDLEEPIR
jgi:hypothetical protein